MIRMGQNGSEGSGVGNRDRWVQCLLLKGSTLTAAKQSCVFKHSEEQAAKECPLGVLYLKIAYFYGHLAVDCSKVFYVLEAPPMYPGLLDHGFSMFFDSWTPGQSRTVVGGQIFAATFFPSEKAKTYAAQETSCISIIYIYSYSCIYIYIYCCFGMCLFFSELGHDTVCFVGGLDYFLPSNFKVG